MSAAFTPGPWAVGDEDVGMDGVSFLEIHAGEYMTPTFVGIARVEGPFKDDEFQPCDDTTRANAYLIAAAPELYEALIAFEVGLPTASKMAKAALAKARGEQVPA